MPHPIDDKLATASDAVALIGDGRTVAVTGFCGCCHPEALTAALGRRFAATGRPRGISVMHAAGQGDWAGRGLEHLAVPGLLGRIVGGHFAACKNLGRLALEGGIEAYNFPQGVISHLYRDIAAGKPGTVTHVGLDTFVDPIQGGGRINGRTTEELVERVEIGGRTWLWYKAFPIHVGLLRAWAADPLGNLVYDGEAVVTEPLAIALAARNSARIFPRAFEPGEKGLVIAQVRKLLDKPAPPHTVRVPGVLVDRIVVADPAEHPQTFSEDFNRRYCTPLDLDEPLSPDRFGPALPLDERRVIASRACDELEAGMIVNLGIGMPEGISRMAAERGVVDKLTFTVEAGVVGGTPASGLSFGAAVHPMAIVEQPAMFDLYNGRGHDFAALGCAQVDVAGNVNVSRFSGRLAGCGGFIDITQSAPRLVFCGTLTAGGLEVAVESGRLRIVREGKVRKFIKEVEQITFSAARSRRVGQEVLYVTERAVFRLTEAGVELIEVAPGIDVEKQVLALMDFAPIIRNVKSMPAGAFR